MKKVFLLVLVLLLTTLVACNNLENGHDNFEPQTIELKNLSVFNTEYFSIENEHQTYFSEENITLINQDKEVDAVLNNYLPEYKESLTELVKNVKKDDSKYFSTKSLIIVPFMYSSSETDIIMKEINFEIDENVFNIHFELFSPEYADMDLLVKFYVVEIIKENFDKVTLDQAEGSIVVFNTRNETNKSIYYGSKNNNESSEQEKENTKNDSQASEVSFKLLKINKILTSEIVKVQEKSDVLTEEDLTLITNSDQLNLVLNNYKKEFKAEIENLTTDFIGDNRTYFEDKSLIIVPFMYSSSETKISLESVRFNETDHKFNVDFNIYSPEYNDFDLQIQFYVVEISKEDIRNINLDYVKGFVSVFNSRNETNESLYYGGNKRLLV